MFIGPKTQTLKWTIRQRSISLKEKVKGCRYILGNHINIKLETPLFIIHIYETDSGIWKIDFNFHEKVASTKEALRWIKFLIISSEEKMFELEKMIIRTKDNLDNLLIDLYKIKDYFEIIENLEQEYDIDFEYIDNYNNQNYINALLLLSYCSKKTIRYPIDEECNYIFKVDEANLNGTIPILQKADLMMLRIDKLKKIQFCGRFFSFNYMMLLYNDIKVTNCEKLTDDDKSLYLVSIAANKETEEVIVLDSLPESYGKEHDEEGIAIFYKPGEREKYEIPEASPSSLFFSAS